MQSELRPCPLCANLSPNMEQTAARTAAQIGCTMQCRECGRTYETQAAEITRLTEALRAAEEREKGFVEALIWCSGSTDFNEGGQAREGWLKLCRPLIDAALKGPSHDAARNPA